MLDGERWMSFGYVTFSVDRRVAVGAQFHLAE